MFKGAIIIFQNLKIKIYYIQADMINGY